MVNKPSIICYFPSNNIRTTKNKQKLQILEVLHIRNIPPKFNRINFESNAIVLKCL